MLWLYFVAAIFAVYTLPSLLRSFFKSSPPRVVLVTGASGGLGKIAAEAICAAFPQCYVYGTSRGASEPDTAVKGAKPAQINMLKLDVCNQASVNACVKAIVAKHGFIDALVNNAGICWSTRTATTRAEDCETQFDTNLKGVIRMSSAVSEHMLSQQASHGEWGRSKIINVGSAGGLVALPYMSLYSASKAALAAYSNAMRMEMKRFGVAVSLIAPGDLKPGQAGVFKSADFDSDDVAVRAEEICRQNEADGTDPTQVGKTIVGILGTARPAATYLIGPDAYLVAFILNRVLPEWLTELGVMWWYSVPQTLTKGGVDIKAKAQ